MGHKKQLIFLLFLNFVFCSEKCVAKLLRNDKISNCSLALYYLIALKKMLCCVETSKQLLNVNSSMSFRQINFLLVFSLVSTQLNSVNCIKEENGSVLSVAVIGAGVSGLCSAKHAIAQGLNVTIFEQSEEIGGIWYYTDEVGKDQYGVDIHTSMYRELR